MVGINLLAVTMLVVDSALCGRLPEGEIALEALGYATQIVFLLLVAMMGVVVGTVALVARAYGGKAIGRVEDLLIQSTQLTVLVGVGVGIVGIVIGEPVIRMLGADDEVTAVGVSYLQPLMIGTPFAYLTVLYAGIMRAVGNTRIPFLCSLGANVINAVLNYGLVLGNLGMPALGVEGSAIGTVIAQFCNVVALIVVLRRGAIPGVKLALRPRRIDRPLAVELYRVGWPAAADMLVLNAGFMTAIGMLGRIDSVAVAAHGLGLRVQGLAFVPGLGVAQATAAMIGQSLGAGDIDRARRIGRASMVLCCAIMWLSALAIVIAAYPVVAVFDIDAGSPLEGYAVEWLRWLGLAMFPAGLNIALTGVLQGAGATRTSLRINISTTIAVQVPLGYVLAFGFGLGETGVWLSFPLAFVAKAAIIYVIYKREKWAVTGVKIK